MKRNIVTGIRPAHTAHERSPLNMAVTQQTRVPRASNMRTKPMPMPKLGLPIGELALINHGRITAEKTLSNKTHTIIAIPRPNPHQANRVAGRPRKRFMGGFIIIM